MMQRCLAWLQEIGYTGLEASQIVTNKAKHNQMGWLEFTYCLSHMDPTRDSSSWHGILLIIRLCVDGEQFPNIATGAIEDIFSIFVYPSARDRSKPLEPTKLSNNFAAYFDDCEVVCAKVTHQPRFQAIQEMDREGIPEPIVRRMTGHKGKDQTVLHKSYANNPPTSAVVHRAGGNPDSPKTFDPTPFKLSPQEKAWCDELLRALVPGLVEQHDLVCTAFNAAKSHTERTKKRLYTKKGMLASMLRDVRNAFVMAASPELDPVTFLLMTDRRSIRAKYGNETLAVVFNLPAFSLPCFRQLEVSILNRLIAKENLTIVFNPEGQSAMERFVIQQVRQPLVQEHHQLRRQLQHEREQDRLEWERRFQWMISQQQGAPPLSAVPPAVTPSPSVTYRASQINQDNDDSSLESIPMPTTLADGITPRKRRPAVRQHDAISQECKRRQKCGESQQDVELVVLSDTGCITFPDYWNWYKAHYREKEIAGNGAWRRDFQGSRNRSQWWSQRSAMFRCVEHYMDAMAMSEEAAVEKATTIYNGIPKKGIKPDIKAINKAFKEEMKCLGINLKGRPPKKPTSKPRATL